MHKPLFTLGEQQLLLPGPVGLLETLTTRAEESLAGVAIICHPHPLQEGTMRNKVVTILAKTLAGLGFATVRFNYRGVGLSAGSYGNKIGEIEDLLAVKSWVQSELPDYPLLLAGFSFGAYISASVANQCDDVVRLISVAPAVNHADFAELTNITCPWLVIQGQNDEIVPYEQVAAFADNPPSPLTLISVPETGHFFHGKLLDLREIIGENLVLM